jgi:nucleotide-binding universal stress UspA family protein
MRDTRPSSASVVVGIDGSRTAEGAALWAVDEAIARDVPLRLVYTIEPSGAPTTSEDAERALLTAESAVRQAFTAVESTDKPVKVEVEILQGRAAEKLLEASRAAVMMCVGAIGNKHASAGRVGSTAAALASRAHCPVAVIRGQRQSSATPKSIVVEVDKSAEGEQVLQRGIDEAVLRNAPLVVVSVWHPNVTNVHDTVAVAEQNKQLTAVLDRRLARSTRGRPGLDATTVAAPGGLLTYLSRHAQEVQLVVVGRGRAHGVTEMTGPPSYAALHDTDCSVLICDPHNPL